MSSSFPGRPFMPPPSMPPVIASRIEYCFVCKFHRFRFFVVTQILGALPSMATPPPPPRTTYRAGPTINQRPQMYVRPPTDVVAVPQYEGPIITVFCGKH